MFKIAAQSKRPLSVLVLWRTKEHNEVLGNHRRQSQQSRLELGLRLNRGLLQANVLFRLGAILLFRFLFLQVLIGLRTTLSLSPSRNPAVAASTLTYSLSSADGV